MEHCSNNGADRKVGAFWERKFCELAAREGFTFTPMQIGRSKSAQAFSRDDNGHGPWINHTLPDITVWTFPGQHHEIKHKNPTSWKTYGLEVYRFEALLLFAEQTRQDVLYTIHNHDLSGGRNSKLNQLEHWFTVSVHDLNGQWNSKQMGKSWVDGEAREVPIYYWSTSFWVPLKTYWNNIKMTVTPIPLWDEPTTTDWPEWLPLEAPPGY